MQFRCYTCGFVFHDGLPPLEALTDQQMSLVQGPRTKVEDVRLLLLDTVFSGMGAANFCDSCLLAIVDNPSAFRAGAQDGHTTEQNLDAVWCACGLTLSTDSGDWRTQSKRRDWVDINRLHMRHVSDSC